MQQHWGARRSQPPPRASFHKQLGIGGERRRGAYYKVTGQDLPCEYKNVTGLLFATSSSYGVLESLHPPPTLEELGIDNYPGRAFPSWVGEASFLLLRQVTLFFCANCTQLPPLGQLPCLKRLSIYRLSGVKEVGEEFLHLGIGLGDDDQWGTSIVAFPQLESLVFIGMDCWER